MLTNCDEDGVLKGSKGKNAGIPTLFGSKVEQDFLLLFFFSKRSFLM